MSLVGTTVKTAAIFGCSTTRLLPEESDFFARVRPFGFILFARNIESHEQIRSLCTALRQAVGWNAPIFIDQEGGRVQRLRAPLAREWPTPLDHAEQAGSKAPIQIFERYKEIAQELRALGITANCAPVADIARSQSHPVLRNRCFGSSPEQVTKLAKAAAEGLLAGGVLPVIKHIPGLGRAAVDSHTEPPYVRATLKELGSSDFRPFQDLCLYSMGMTTHVIFEALDQQPATVSPTVISLIRDEIGFDGLLMTDDISMEALNGPVEERSRSALDAGCDVTLHCNGQLEEMRKIATLCPLNCAKAAERMQRVMDQHSALSELFNSKKMVKEGGLHDR